MNTTVLIIAFSAVSILVLIIAFTASQSFKKELGNFTSDLRLLGNNHFQEVNKLLKQELSPTIHLHDGPDAVASRMEQIIRKVADDPALENRQITFYGAASLAAMPADPTSDENKDRVDEPLTPSDVYWNAILHASNNQVRMRRYISLFTEREIRKRSEKVQSQYIKWLRKQIQLLSDDVNYQLIDVPRAPQWGTNMARIIAKGVVMDITGNGRAAIVISDDQIAERIRVYAREAITGKNALNQPKHYGLTIAGSVEKFREHTEMIAAICGEAQSEDGE